VVLLLVGCGSVPPEEATDTAIAAPVDESTARLDGIKALFVVPDRFNHTEYRVTQYILEDLGAQVAVASWSSGPVMGSAGKEVQPELQVEDVRSDGYHAIVLIGGQGVQTGDPEVQRIVQAAYARGDVVAAICAAQGILSRSGLVQGGGVDTIAVEHGGLVIRASGPRYAREFGFAIAAALGQRSSIDHSSPSGDQLGQAGNRLGDNRRSDR
jgi:hypothetical protein